MKRQTNWIVGVSDGKVHEYKIGDVTYFVSAEFERSSQTNLRDRVQRTVVSNLIPLTPGQASDTIHYRFVGYIDIPAAPLTSHYIYETRQGVAVEYIPA